jgi:ribonuclease VapC
MLFLDASAITAIIAGESSADRLLDVLEQSNLSTTSPIAVYETVLAIKRIKSVSVEQAKRDVLSFLELARVSIEPISSQEAEVALTAYARFGKSHHSAALNMGDCFAYAATVVRNARLLFIGNDFNQTDVPLASLRN